MKIDLIVNDGSPMKVIPEDIYGRGVGGAELAMISLMEQLAVNGHSVRVFNDPSRYGQHGKIFFGAVSEFQRDDDRDILIVFRSPNPRAIGAKAERIIWWSCDQQTTGSFSKFQQYVDLIVTISPYHTDYMKRSYDMPEEKMHHIDLGVRDDYDLEIEKVKNKLIYCSIPDRGLAKLFDAWPMIRGEVPDATLVITSDYRLWGQASPNNHHHRLLWAGSEGVEFLGKVPRSGLIIHQLEAEVMAYPCTYEELFCISAAECQVAGAYPVTSEYAALATTNVFGSFVKGDARGQGYAKRFADKVVALLTDEREELEKAQREMREKAKAKWSWAEIAKLWEHLFKTGEFKR